MHTGISMLEAFGTMIGYTLTSGDDNNQISWDAESIIRQQCQDLQFIHTALRVQFDAMREAKLKVRNIHEVARQAGVPVEVAEICVFVATGIQVRVNGKLPPFQS
ncbi:hypothetical protein [Tabrizicola soli]|uniref:Ketopantoate reductase C-terminal domain-containing protein n=1 Tax=Tabrizicola soli TaxID=2185115 RepID=A0ABV7DX92_9RHOB|nr:hypothetical protein [Tabrizicola soli]